MRFIYFYAHGYQKLPQGRCPVEGPLQWFIVKYIGSTAENVATLGQAKGVREP